MPRKRESKEKKRDRYVHITHEQRQHVKNFHKDLFHRLFF